MAIFEKRFERKVTLDDTQPILCVIETAQLVEGHTEYVLRLQRGPDKNNNWKVLRRYNDFVQLNKSLQPSGISLPLPGKKVIGNMRPDFIAERRQGLQEYINIVLMNPILASSLATKRFVDPDTYSSPFHDQAQQNASLCLRTDGLYILGQTMGLIGWRLRKHYFKVTSKNQGQSSGKSLTKSSSQSHSKHQQQHSTNGGESSTAGSNQTELVLSWTEYGPDRYVDDKELQSIFKSLAGLQHPYIEPISYCACNENGALTVRKFHQQGSVKDILCMSTPKKPFLIKYGNPKGRTALSLRQVAVYGRQILEALRFLHSKGMPYGHLHSGNIVIVDDTVRLLDLENFVLGVPAFYRPFFVQHSKIHSAETIDVYCFGHVMFEMSMGYPLQESVARQITDCPEALKNLLEMILSKEACKTGLPSLDQLAGHRFFQEYASSLNEILNSPDSVGNKPHFKLSTNAKEQIRNAMQKAETRVRDEQKSVKNQKRLVRVQEMMSSEEEKKKSKAKAKLEHKHSKLRQQNSLQLLNGSPGPSMMSSIIRTDSVTSVNTSNETTPAPSVQSASPLPPPLPPPPPLQSAVSTSIEETEGERSALLESICKFNRGSLRKVRSND